MLVYLADGMIESASILGFVLVATASYIKHFFWGRNEIIF